MAHRAIFLHKLSDNIVSQQGPTFVKTFKSRDVNQQSTKDDQPVSIKTFSEDCTKQPMVDIPVVPVVKKFQSRPFEQQTAAPIKSRPLFSNYSVSTEISEEEDEKIATLLETMGFSDFVLTVTEKTRLIALSRDIKITDHQYITDYGQQTNADTLLSGMDNLFQNDVIPRVRDIISNVMNSITKLDPRSINNNVGIFGVFKKKLTKDDFIAATNEIIKQLSKANDLLTILKRNIPSIDAESDVMMQQYRMLSIYIIAGQKRIEQELEVLNATPDTSDFFKQQQMIDFKQSIERFQRKIESLTKIRMTVMLRIAQFRLEFNNVLSTIDQITEIITLTIPTWKQQMMLLFSNSGINDNNIILANVESIQAQLLTKLSNSSGVKNV